ncbi:MAG: hypothetical protein DMG57_18450 [Acidobacteria bacterium]|nr:MAG: hypothetical protein DMG57_18450 [Acidobacteriota bacterium]
MKQAIFIFCCLQTAIRAQEATSGFEVRATASESASYTHQLAAQNEGPLTGGFRAVLYPTWKLNDHWAVSGAIQTHSTPYFFEEFSTQHYGVKTDVLQANLSYSRFWNGGSVVVRLGELPSAFGSFLLRYDDAVNPLIDMPMAYGYYYKGVSNLGLFGSQADLTLGKLDMRAQFVNASPANRRSIFDRDQYGNWAGGAGYTIRQGFRVGVSAYRGPYLHRNYAFYFPGEAKPRDLPGSAFGVDVQWGRGPWNVYGEWQRFQMDYRAIPTFKEHTGYAEGRWVLHPRWYIASRVGYLRANAFAGRQVYEFVGGFRPNRHQLAKIGYQIEQCPNIRGTLGNILSLQLVTTFRAISIARD